MRAWCLGVLGAVAGMRVAPRLESHRAVTWEGIGFVMSNSADSAGTIAAIGRSVLERFHYLVLGTADGSGRPWTSPVYFAALECREFFWVSAPDARHSRNIQIRPQVSMVVFDSTVPLGEGSGVYMTAVAEQLPAASVEWGIWFFSAASVRDGGRPWSTRTCSRRRGSGSTAPRHRTSGSCRRGPAPIFASPSTSVDSAWRAVRTVRGFRSHARLIGRRGDANHDS
jgi:Pyridoxamine 5'-phosphate oxidase